MTAQLLIQDDGRLVLTDPALPGWRGMVDPHDQHTLAVLAPGLTQEDRDQIDAKCAAIPLPPPTPPTPPPPPPPTNLQRIMAAWANAGPLQKVRVKREAVAAGQAVAVYLAGMAADLE